ncbi:MAG TPA: oxygenase MpaB family protein [Methylomirabilota bacterium]|nr:oxygenase MpaB family protein [Methylomirabilota bacterium]
MNALKDPEIFQQAGPFDATPVTHRIHREVAVLAGWGRAILLQMASPRIAWAIREHSGFRAEKWGRLSRLSRTLNSMLIMTFGDEEAARRAARGIDALHGQVHGVVGEPAGSPWAGASYSARDPELMRWVHATLVDSFVVAYERYVGPLSLQEKDRYCAETAALELLFHLPPGLLPRSHEELERYMDDMLASDQIAVTETARMLAGRLLSAEPRWIGRPVSSVLELVGVGLLPSGVRDAYGFAWSGRRQLALEWSSRAVRAVLPWVPGRIRYWPISRPGGPSRARVA